MTTVGIDLEQFIRDPYATGIQRVLQQLAINWPDGETKAEFVVPNKRGSFTLIDRATAAELLSLGGVTKAGFGLGDDRRHIVRKLGVEPVGLLELNHVFHQRGYRKDMGVKGAVAVLFNERFIKSKKAATSNWANARLSEAQLVYAANDAYAAICVWDALGLG